MRQDIRIPKQATKQMNIFFDRTFVVGFFTVRDNFSN
jgi:hypothetical protein